MVPTPISPPPTVPTPTSTGALGLQAFLDAIAAGNGTVFGQGLRDRTLASDHFSGTVNGWFATVVAAANGRVDMLRALLDAGAPVDQTMAHGETAMYVAAQRGRPAVVELMFERGCAADAVNTKGASAICVAAENGHFEVVRPA